MSVSTAFRLLFEPIELGPIRVRNRLMLTTHGGALPAGRYLRYLEARAAGGIGLVAVSGAQAGVAHITSVASRFIPSHAGDFDGTGPDPATQAGIAHFDGTVTPMLRERAEAVHRHGAACVGQIFHLGSYRDSDGFRPSIAPSVVVDEEDRHLPHALDESELERLVVAFGHAVRRVRDAGMDGAEIHCAHGFLLNEFLSPYSNRRQDRYGGSFENRLRLLREVLDSAEAQAPGFPIGIRINGDELVSGGLDPDGVAEIVGALASRLVYVNVSGGNASGLRDGLRLAYSSPWLVKAEHNVAAAARIKARTSLPVVVAGRVLGAVQAERILERGEADLVGMVRPLIADPDLPRKSREGRLADIRPCLGQNECHGFHGTRGHLVCAVNAAAGREEEFDVEPGRPGRRVVVVGGGPAGLEAARVAALRRAEVTLLEREPDLGGQLRWVARLPGLDHVEGYVAYQRRQLEAMGVEVRLGEAATAESIAALEPEAVIVATGSLPFRPEVPGIESDQVLTAADLLGGRRPEGARIAVVGGQQDHLPPLLVSLLLAEAGHRVDLLSELASAGQGVERRTLNVLLAKLAEHEVRVHSLTELAGVEEGRLRLRNHFTKRESMLDGIDSVVLACGGWPLDSLTPELRARGLTAHAVGDCQAPRRIIHAVLDGARAGTVV